MDDDPYDDGSCWECGGEGFIFDCFDGSCAGADMGCDGCTKPCPICTPKPKDYDALRKVLGDALERALGEDRAKLIALGGDPGPHPDDYCEATG